METNNGTRLMEVLQRNGTDMAAFDLLRTPLDEMSTDEVHFAWSVLDVIEKLSKERKDAMRERLLDDAKEHGDADDKGSYLLECEMGNVKAELRISKGAADQAVVRDLLRKKKIPVSTVLVRRTVVDFDHKRFESLVKEGQITEHERDVIYGTAKKTYALKVKAPGFLPKALQNGSTVR